MHKWKDVVNEKEVLEALAEQEDEETKSYCKKCLDRGYQIFMGPKILMPGQKRDEDYENWKMCPRCYDVIPAYEMEQEATISDVIEKSENPFEQGKTVIQSLPNRTGKRNKSRVRKRKNKYVLHEDSDINREMRQYGERNVRVLQDSSV